MKIGFFDSGLGGLTILKAVARELPEYDYLFYGDTKNLPLGDKSEKEIFEHTKAGVEYLFNQNCLIAVIACNTASAETLRKLQDTLIFDQYPERRILGVIIPTIEALIESKVKNALLLATKRTVDSNKYDKELSKQSIVPPKLHSCASPELVPLIESNKYTEALRVAKSAIAEKESEVGEVDGVILGCTHYTVFKDELREMFKDKIKIFSQDEIIPEKLKLYLGMHRELEIKMTRGGERNIFLTEHREDYDNLMQTLLQGHFIERA